MKLKPIRDQVVVLVGASSGIGREAAILFARRGARLVVAARDEEGLQTLVDEIHREGGEAIAVRAEVSVFEDVRRIGERAVEQWGRVDTWVNLAAVELWATVEQTTPKEFVRVIDVDLLGQIFGAKVALPLLKKEGRGAIIHIGSVESRRPLPLQSAYAAAKHGVDGFAKVLRMELRHDRVPISVTTILPGTTNTPLFEKARTKIGVEPKGPAPVYRPGKVARAIVRAAEKPTREVAVGGAARTMLWLDRYVTPRLLDLALSRKGIAMQRSEKPKTEDAPNNLFAPVSGFDRVQGVQ
jgi:NAD(P)-dependent dehydrogenase (short-subunit alcohol dehydrogenase family)